MKMTPIESTYVNAVGYQDEILAIYFTRKLQVQVEHFGKVEQ